jgi:nucleoside-diphosphate-sugar epimerase
MLASLGVEQRRGDISDKAALAAAMKGCTAVIHCAAKAGIWGRYEEFYRSNVVGTQAVLAAMATHHIKTLVYTSSPSVVFGRDDICGANEDLPYPASHLCSYAATKAMAEKLVLAANSHNGLATTALRPHLIWGPGDPHFLPRLCEKARTGTLRRIGNGGNRVDVIYIDNAAAAHLQALHALTDPDSPPAGKAFFLGQEEAVNLWDFVDQLLIACGEKPLRGASLPFPLAYGIGAALECCYSLFRIYQHEPALTRFLALQLSKSHYFTHCNASRTFAYSPVISIREGLSRIAERNTLQ